MDQATLIKGRAAQVWMNYAETGGLLRTMSGALPLRRMLEDLAERVLSLTVVEDDSLSDTNIEGEYNRQEGLILLRPGLDTNRAIFVLAHELGHAALEHPLHRIADTAVQINSNITPDDLSVERQQRITGMELSEAALTALRGYNQRDMYEMQANAFATELLVPGAMLRRAIEDDPYVNVSALAERLGVPENLIHVGLAQALFCPQRGSADTGSAVSATLDPDQQRAATCPTPALVIAGPGAGKTRVLVARYARLVAEGVAPREILALTFANKAAGEMRERLAALVTEEHKAAVEVATFHAFGLQLLQQYGERIGLKLPLRLITPIDVLLLFRRRAACMALGIFEDLPRMLDNLSSLLQAIARAKEENAGPERWAELACAWTEANPDLEVPVWARDGSSFYAEYQRTLRRYGLLDYGDLQMEALRLFTLPEVAAEIRERYRYILVDEFQDINYVSGQLVRALDGGRGVVWVVGDPRQSIYGFRGASPVNLSRFRSHEYYPGASVITLTTNYRSVPDIVEAGMAVPVPAPGDPVLIPPPLRADRAPQETGPAVTAVHVPHGGDELRWLAAEVGRQRETGRAFSDMVVLVRKNRHAAQAAGALTAAGIPHRWGGPIEERPVFRVLISALMLAADQAAGIVGLTTLSPGADLKPDIALSEADRRVLLADRRGRWSARHLLAMAVKGQIDGLSEAGRSACLTLHHIAMALSGSARPHHNLCLYLFEQAEWLRCLFSSEARSDARGRAILATVGQILDLAASFAAQREALARSVQEAKTENEAEPDRLETETSTKAFLAYLQAALQSGSLGVPNELDIDGDAVSIITAHRSKGLEWPVVFVPYCVEGEFPSKEQESTLPLPPGLITTDDTDPTATHLREEACLFYVAVTRARDRLFLSSAQRYTVRSRGPISKLCENVIEGLKVTGHIDLSEVSVPEPEAERSDEQVTTGEAVAFPVSETIHKRDLDLFQECPRRFLYAQVYSLADHDKAFLAYHRSVYGAARDANGDPQALRDMFEARWSEQGPSDDHWQAPLLRRAAEHMLSRLETQIQSGIRSSYRQEKVLKLCDDEGNSFNICFTVDEEGVKPDGQRFYRRHKHRSQLPKTPPDEEDMTLYALHADQAGVETEILFYYPHAGAEMKPKIGQTKKTNLQKRMLQLISEMRRGEMPPKPGNHCNRCPYSLICSRSMVD